MLAHLLQRIRHAVAGRMRQRVTKAGFGFSLTLALVAAVAFLSGNNLLFLLLACLIAMLLLSGFLSRLSLAGLELDFVFPEHISARSTVLARMRLHNEKSWMASFSISVAGAKGSAYSSELYFPMLPSSGTVEEGVKVSFERRGRHRENSFRIRSRFPFGFAEREVQVTLRREALVYPCLRPRPDFDRILRQLEGSMEAMIRGRGHDFYRIRPYEHGEEARMVDWRATAHTGELQVREFAREQDPLVEIFFDLQVPHGQEDWFEQAIECAAYLCWQVSARAARVRFRTQNFDREIPVEGDIYTILKYLALVESVLTKAVVGPRHEDSLRVLVSASPARLAAAGWEDAELVGPDAFSRPDYASSGPEPR